MASKKDWLNEEREIDPADERIEIDVMGHNCVRDVNGKMVLLGRSTGNLHHLVGFVNRVIRTDQVPFKFAMNHGKKVAIAASALARYFERMSSMASLYSSALHYAPHVTLYFECFAKHYVKDCIADKQNSPVADGGLIAAEVFNDFVDYMRKEGKRINILKKVSDWENNVDDNKARLKAYMDALFERYARLVVVRIDLLYKIACLDEKKMEEAGKSIALEDWNDAVSLYGREGIQHDALETQARLDVTELIKDRDHLFDNMRAKPSIFEHLVGKVWRIEWSRVGGYHLHVAFIFDGSKVQKHEWLGEQIGQYWVHVVTQKRGLFHNCNRNQERYGARWGIGEVNYDDTEKREKLMHALGYLAKRDQFVYVKPSPKCKCFGTGHMPKAKPAAGRPRKKEVKKPS